eukprot:gene23516-28522_t
MSKRSSRCRTLKDMDSTAAFDQVLVARGSSSDCSKSDASLDFSWALDLDLNEHIFDVALVDDEPDSNKSSSDIELAKRNRKKRRLTMTADERREEDRDWKSRFRFTFGRMFLRDIRRNFALMHVNVLNSLDTNMIKQFFNDYARPDVLCTNKLALSIYGLPLSILTSRQQVVDLWTSYVGCKPDATSKLLSNRIIRHYNTKTTDVRFLVHFLATNVTVLDSSDASFTPNITEASESAPLVQKAPSVQLTPVNLVVQFSFQLDDRHAIYAVEVDGRFVPDPDLSKHYANYRQHCCNDIIVKDGGREVELAASSSANLSDD